jgi:hypothetical protein
MDSVWRRYHNLFVKPNRQKNLMLTVQSVQSDVAGPYRPYDDMSGGDVAGIDWLTVVESRDDTCLVDGKWYEDTWPNPWAPRVTHCLVYIVM